MIRTIRTGLVASTLSIAALAAPAQEAFQNLDFETGTIVSNDPMFGSLAWELAVPAWSHGAGPDSDTVYRGLTHVGITPWYLLIDATAQSGVPLRGNYSLAFANGHSNPQSENSAWIESFVSQQGTLSGSVRSIQFLASGNFELRVNGVALPLLALGQNAYGADISAYAGQSVELRFANVSNQIHDPVVLDDVRLSSVALVPEPSVTLSALAGLGWLTVTLRRRVNVPSSRCGA